MAQTPHVCRQRSYLVRCEFRPAHGRHRATILLWLRHTFRYRFQDSGKTAIAPQPFFTGQIGTQRRPCSIRTMAAGTGRCAHLSVVNTITQGNHVSRHAFGKRGACIWMCALRRLGWGCDDIPSRSRRTRTWSDRTGKARGAALIDNSIDPSTNIVGNVERTIRSDCEARGTMGCTFRSHYRSRKSIRENFTIAGCTVARKWLKDDVVAALGIRSSIPRTMKGDEHAIAITGWELFLVVVHHCVRCPMGGKYRSRGELVRARANRLAS